MTYQTNCTLPEEILEQIAEEGMDAIPEMIRLLVNEAMRSRREQHQQSPGTTQPGTQTANSGDTHFPQ